MLSSSLLITNLLTTFRCGQCRSVLLNRTEVTGITIANESPIPSLSSFSLYYFDTAYTVIRRFRLANRWERIREVRSCCDPTLVTQ